MNGFERVVRLAAIAGAALTLIGCERKITRVEVVQEPQSCFACHSDQNTILVSAEQQWQNSTHASGDHIDRSTASCAGCHTSEGFLRRVAGLPVEDVDNPTTIHCFTCHAPHTTGDFRLRWTAPTVLLDGTTFDLRDGNLCAACHQARRNVDTYVTGRVSLNSRWGPHYGVQGDMLIGSNGYEYDGYAYDISNHRTATDQACADCHVLRATSNNVVGGHTFAMRGDLDGEEILNTAACEGCHSSADDFNVNGMRDSVEANMGVLRERLVTAGLWSGGSLESGGAPRTATTSADSAGAVWNLLMAEEDQSHGVHNTKYTLALLRSSILYLGGALPQPAALRSSRD